MVLHRPVELARVTGKVGISTYFSGYRVNQDLVPSRTSRQDYRSKFAADGASWWLPGPRKGWDEENRFAATAGFGVCSRSCRGPGRKLQLRSRHGFLQIQEL